MKANLLPVIMLTATIAVCGTYLQAEDAPKVIRLEENLTYGELLVVGEAEQVNLPEFDVTWKARIDSGATTTSIHALDIEEFERDGNEWVRFTVRNDDLDVSVPTEKQVQRYAEIRKRGEDDFHRRAVVEMVVVIGEVERRIEVNLTDRTGFEFPILIGRNYLSGTAIIDVSQDYVQKTPTGEE